MKKEEILEGLRRAVKEYNAEPASRLAEESKKIVPIDRQNNKTLEGRLTL